MDRREGPLFGSAILVPLGPPAAGVSLQEVMDVTTRRKITGQLTLILKMKIGTSTATKRCVAAATSGDFTPQQLRVLRRFHILRIGAKAPAARLCPGLCPQKAMGPLCCGEGAEPAEPTPQFALAVWFSERPEMGEDMLKRPSDPEC
eukprot:Skav213854  [mRNA]  locus=scaffold2366:173697:184792:- [translate_table: standard]